MNCVNNTKSTCLLAGFLLLGACGHDARRTNPLDPELTPPVELQVTRDDTAGTVTLTWSSYDGESPFAEYRVVRNVADRTTVDTLTVIKQIASTTFVDTSMVRDITYAYRILSVNVSGFKAESLRHTVRITNLAAVRIEDLEYNAKSASASVTWSQYPGADFSAYRVMRTAPGLEAIPLHETEDRADTSFVDLAGLRVNTDYSYTIMVVTKRGEELESAPASESFHQLLDEWPLDIDDLQAVRLYVEDEDGITALVIGRGEGASIQLFFSILKVARFSVGCI